MVNHYRSQVEQEVLCAEPLELVVMLYTGLRGFIRDARRQLAADDIAGRARSVSRALAIVGELAVVLDLQKGGELATGLQRLYAYLTTRLLEGNFRQIDAPFAEAESLAGELLEAWSAISRANLAATTIPCYQGDAGFAGAGSLSVRG